MRPSCLVLVAVAAALVLARVIGSIVAITEIGQAATISSAVCRWSAGTVVHKKGERCIVLRRSHRLVTVRIAS